MLRVYVDTGNPNETAAIVGTACVGFQGSESYPQHSSRFDLLHVILLHCVLHAGMTFDDLAAKQPRAWRRSSA